MTALVLASSASANLIVNGSFEDGNTGFTSDYTFKPTFRPPDLDAGQYQIVTNNTQAHAAWGVLAAQSGTNFFIANGSSDTNASPWIQTISINPGDIIVTTDTNVPVYYRFQAYIANVFPEAPPKLAFEMSLNNSGVWQTLTTSSIEVTNVNNWMLTYRDGYFGFAPSTISFRLRNTETAGGGNDFAIDSLYFGLTTNAPGFDPVTTPIDSIGAITGGVVPEPGTWAAAALLALTAGYAGWRRRKLS